MACLMSHFAGVHVCHAACFGKANRTEEPDIEIDVGQLVRAARPARLHPVAAFRPASARQPAGCRESSEQYTGC